MFKKNRKLSPVILCAGILFSATGWVKLSYSMECGKLVAKNYKKSSRSLSAFTLLFETPEIKNLNSKGAVAEWFWKTDGSEGWEAFRRDYHLRLFEKMEGVSYPIAFRPDVNIRKIKLSYPYAEGFQGQGPQETARGFQFGLVAGFDEQGSLLVEVLVDGKFQRWALTNTELQTAKKSEFASNWLHRHRYQLFLWSGKSFDEYSGADRVLLETYLNYSFYGNKRYLRKKGAPGYFYKVLYLDQNGDLILWSNQQNQIRIKPEELLDFQFSSESQRFFTGEIYWQIPGVTSGEMLESG